jgi:membrane associated rhomboid family serine protease
MLFETPVTFILLVLNALVGFHTLFMDPSLVGRWSFRPEAVKRGEHWRWVSAGFVHVGLAHLAFNMLTLYFFGRVIEGVVGPGRFLAIYFGSELAANALTYWRHRNTPEYSAAGASGAVSGVVFAFCLFFPFQPIYFFLIPVGIPALLFAVAYVALSIYAANQGGGRIAHEAHLGGAFGGLVLTVLLYPAALEIFARQVGL